MTNVNTDHGQLAPTKEYLKGKSPDEVVNVIADKGYHRDEDYITCLENGIIPNVIPDDGKDTYVFEVEYQEAECDPASIEPTELAKCLHAGKVSDAYKNSIEDIEVVEARYKPEETKEKAELKNPDRTEGEMKARAVEGYFVRDPEGNCVYCPGGAVLYQKSIKKNGDIRYCNKKMCRKFPLKDKCATSQKYPWKEVDFSKDSLEKKEKWHGGEKAEPAEEPGPEGTDGSWKKREGGFHYKKKKVVRFKLRPNREKMDKRKCT